MARQPNTKQVTIFEQSYSDLEILIALRVLQSLETAACYEKEHSDPNTEEEFLYQNHENAVISARKLLKYMTGMEGDTE